MTPDRRLDQLEPLIADGLQKIDRLIEGQGQLLDVATRADGKADTTAKGVANLTIAVQEGFTTARAEIAQANQRIDDGITTFRQEVKQEFQQVNQKFDLIIDLLRQR